MFERGRKVGKWLVSLLFAGSHSHSDDEKVSNKPWHDVSRVTKMYIKPTIIADNAVQSHNTAPSNQVDQLLQ